MKNKIYYALAVAILLLTPAMASVAAGNTPFDNGWGSSKGKIVYQQSGNTEQEIIYDTTDLQILYELAK